MEDDQKEDENDLNFNGEINNNKLYLKQIDEISKRYKRKKDKIKNLILLKTIKNVNLKILKI